MPTIAILIPHFGDIDLLENCLASIDIQTRPPDEVCVFNNTGSKLVSRNVKRSFPVLVIESRVNQGFARAVNTLATRASSELILVLNNDAVLDPKCLNEIEKGAQIHEGCSSFALVVFANADELRIQSIGLMYTVYGFGNRSSSISASLLNLPFEVFCPCGAAAVYRRHEFLRIGGLNLGFFFGHEDLELGLRLRLAGYHCVLLSNAKVVHKLSASISNYPRLKVLQAVRNSLWTLLARHPIHLLMAHGKATAKFYFTWWIKLSRAGYTMSVICGLISVFLQIPTILLSRFIFWVRFSRTAKATLRPLFDGTVEAYSPNGHTVIDAGPRREHL